MNSPLAKIGKKLEKNKEDKVVKKAQKTVDAISKDIRSFRGHEQGISTRSGKLILTEDDITDMLRGLYTQRLNEAAKAENYSSGRSLVSKVLQDTREKYYVTYDVQSKKYSLVER